MNILNMKLGELSGGRVLDVGTGSGSFVSMLMELLKDYKEVIGIDSSEKNILAAKNYFKQENVKFIKMDASNIEFEDNSMDTVCISNTLHHLPDMQVILKEMLRVLKPGGLFIINEMICDNQSEKQLSHVNVHHLCGEIDTLLGTYHAKTLKRQEIVDIIEEAGIEIHDVFEYGTNEEQEQEEQNIEEEKAALDSFFNYIDKRVEELNGKKEYQKLKDQTKELKEKLYKVGIYGATQLVVLGRKKCC